MTGYLKLLTLFMQYYQMQNKLSLEDMASLIGKTKYFLRQSIICK
jgi:hypothetical protein